jgi:malate dehydrogenase (oxaloacetate-decarboxylating)(NADP+)
MTTPANEGATTAPPSPPPGVVPPMTEPDRDSRSALDRQALDYHEFPRPGKTEVVSTKPVATQRDLSLAYTPGVAAPCLRIEKDPEAAYRYTNKGNLVAVVTNGTAVLGLGNIGPLAGKPVMEGKGVLFKRLAGVDVFDIEVDAPTVDALVDTVRRIAPTFGGINLEDVKAPECFEVERRLVEALDIPVFHDDQHGTAIIAGAALVNACELVGKRIGDLRIVVSGAGAAGIACANMFVRLGATRANFLFVDSKGVIWKGRREGMNGDKEQVAADTPCRTLADAMRGADAFLGVSSADVLKADMVRSMAPRPIVFALANPDPEIPYPVAVAARDDLVMATGRSDYPNQVNNALCFPFLFRGALDVRARRISDGMKIAAAHALAALAKEPVPESVCTAYGGGRLSFGREYLIPKPLDPRLLTCVAPAVAHAAIEDGTARTRTLDRVAYLARLEALIPR